MMFGGAAAARYQKATSGTVMQKPRAVLDGRLLVGGLLRRAYWKRERKAEWSNKILFYSPHCSKETTIQ